MLVVEWHFLCGVRCAVSACNGSTKVATSETPRLIAKKDSENRTENRPGSSSSVAPGNGSAYLSAGRRPRRSMLARA
eukprot:3185033-Rhodomonas_salina.1